MKINIFLKILLLIIISIIIFFISCDVLTKMNEQEWNEINLEEEEKKEIFIYVTGYSIGGNYDFYTIKYDLKGNVIWNRRFDSGFDDFGYVISLDNSGNIYIGGNRLNIVSDFFIIKYDYKGKLLNTRIDDYGANESNYGIVCNSSNNVFTTGTDGNNFYTFKYDSGLNQILPPQIFDASGNIDQAYGITYSNNYIYVGGYSTQPPGEPAGDIDFTIIKYNASNLNQSIVRYYPIFPIENNNHQAKGVAIDKFGNLYIVGNVTFPGLMNDCILLKYDQNLNLIWEKIIDINNYEECKCIAVDSAGNIYIGISSGSAANYDCYTLKYDMFGNEQWRRHFGSIQDDRINGITVDPIGNVYVTGSIGFAGSRDYLTIKYDFYGNEIWKRFYNSGNNDEAQAVVVGDK